MQFFDDGRADGEHCLADDTCPAYSRPIDAVHVWSYWLSALLVAELVVRALGGSHVDAARRKAASTAPRPPHPPVRVDGGGEASAEVAMRAPFVREIPRSDEGRGGEAADGGAPAAAEGETKSKQRMTNCVNLLGVMLALLTSCVTAGALTSEVGVDLPWVKVTPS